MLPTLRILVAAICSMLFAIHPASAHMLPISTLTLVPGESYLHLELTLNPFELTFFSELDVNRDGQLNSDELAGQQEKIAWRILENLELRVSDRIFVAEISGLSHDYESHHIRLRAHFAVDARRARVALESQLAGLTSGSHVTEVNFGGKERVQAARLDMQSNKVTFDPIEPVEAVGGNEAVQTFAAPKANETAVIALLGLLFVAGIPPAVFCILVGRFRRNQKQLAHAAHARAATA